MSEHDLQNPPQAPDVGTRPSRDPVMDAYLASLNLSDVEIDDHALEAPEAVWNAGTALLGVVLAAALGVALVLPSTLFYQLNVYAGWVEGAAWGLVLVTALSLGPTLYHAAVALTRDDTPERLAQAARDRAAHLGQHPALQPRVLLGVGIVGLGVVLLVLLPHEVQWQGATYSGSWFLATGVATVTGILVGRFIIAHAQASRPVRTQVHAPIVLPPWFRWVTGALWAGAAITILIVHATTPDGDHSREFALSGTSLALGVIGAIWIARRFDELEVKWRKEAENRRNRPSG